MLWSVMKQGMYILPVECRRCKGVFDLWYDLQGEEKWTVKNFTGNKALDRALKESLCWNCRKVVAKAFRGSSKREGGLEKDSNDFMLEM